MKKIDFKSLLGLERSISLSSNQQLNDSQLALIQQVEGFGIDEVYFSTDESKSYPAVFLKKVVSFDESTCKEISLIQQKLWNFQKVLFLYVFNDVEIRIYNCIAKPITQLQDVDYIKKLEELELYKAETSDEKAISRLVSVFSSIAIDSGIIWTLPEVADIRNKINIQRRVDKYLVDSLKNTTEELKKLGLDDLAIIHKIILRSLFLLYLEDRGATSIGFYGAIKAGAEKYFDILKDVDATYKLYAVLEDRFNGNVFSVLEGERQKVSENHLKVVRKCFINGYENDGQTELFDDWRLFDFKIIRIELLSEIYERFLEESNPRGKKGAGAYYTPTSLVELMLDEVLPVSQQYTNYNVKILDPACGSGIFLVEGYKRLLRRYENAHGRKPTDFEELERILLDNIYGIEQNDQAIIVAAFSLYLALVDNLDPKTLWISAKLPCLVNDPAHIRQGKNGNNLFCRDTIKDNEDIENMSVDLVVGNPPFGTENKSKGVVLSDSIRDYCNQNGFAKEMVLPFLHKAIKFSPKGKIAMIFNTKLLTNTSSTYKAFRKWLFQECYVEKVYNFSILRNAPKNFGGQLFGSAIGPVCIAFYQKESPVEKSSRIVYYAPKTYIKTNVLEGVVIDSSDVKYLPREECQKPDTKIWKIAMWGGDRDFELIQSFSKMPKLEAFFSKNNMQYGLGLQFIDSTTKRVIVSNEIPQEYIKPESVNRYKSSSFDDIVCGMTAKSLNLYAEYYGTTINQLPTITAFRRTGKIGAYAAPHLLIKEGLQNWNICASFIDRRCSFNSKVIGVHCENSNILKGITCFLNSLLVQYYVFMCSPSIGIEREEIKKNEIVSVPFVLGTKDLEELAAIYDKYLNEENLIIDTNSMESEINSIIYNKYCISEKDSLLIKDFADTTKSLMVKSVEDATSETKSNEIISYVEVICSILNDFIGDQGMSANGTTFVVKHDTPLVMVKVSFGKEKHNTQCSGLDVQDELTEIDKHLWDEKGSGIYFRKKVNYYDGDDIYIIRPNQRHFWTQSMAMQDASDLIIEILNNKEG